MDTEDRIPGVTFYVGGSDLTKSGSNYIGKVELEAHVTSLDMWEEVLRKIDKLKIYEAQDFHTTMVELLQEDSKQLKLNLGGMEKVLAEVKEEKEQQVSFLKKEVAKVTLRMKKAEAEKSLMVEELERLRVLEKQISNLAGI
jgi:hypothetical protein